WLYSCRHHRVSGAPVVGPQAGERDPLRRLQVAQKVDKLRRGLQEMPPWVFPSVAGTPLDDTSVEKALKRVLKAGEVPSTIRRTARATPWRRCYFSRACHRRTYSAARSRGDSAARRHVREVASDGEQGCRRRTRNNQWTNDRIFDHRPLRTART